MTYQSALTFLFGLQKHGIRLGLDTTDALLRAIGEPQRRYPTVHIGGTNGKGSTAAFCAAVLQAAGYRVGLYTSPHLVDFRERMRINGDMITDSAVADLVAELHGAIGNLDPTFFEFTTVMAFQHFAKCAVDVAVVEVGMGGRFDATNTVMPLVSVITNVALDHQAHLGRTVAEIAFEKAGIIKPGVPVVTGRLTADAATVIERVAEERGAPLTRLGTEVRGDGVSPADFTFIGRTWTIEHLSSPLQGRHQVENAVCALAALEYVSMLGVRVGEDAVRRGCAAVHWEGRLEVLEPHPLLIVDGAHNPAAADVVADFLRAFHAAHPSARILLVLSTMQDKDYEGVLARLAPLADELILTRAQIARAAAVGALHAARPADSPPTFIAEAVADALALAHAHAAPDDLIFVTGSLMLVGEVKALLRGCGLSPLRG